MTNIISSVKVVYMGIKERRTKILLALILLSDVNLDFVTFDEKLQRVFDLSFNQKTRGTISTLLKEKFIEKRTDNNHSTTTNSDQNLMLQEPSDKSLTFGNRYRLTDSGFNELTLKFPFFRFLREKWDSKWRILSYEIPEKKREVRDRLRREVSGWGLGPWHRSFWLTPHPIINNLRELVFQKEEEKYIQAFEAEYLVGSRDILIEKVWRKSTLDKKYRDIFKIWHEVLSKDGEKLDKFIKIITTYVEILKIDPGLPIELVGNNWIGFEAFNVFKEIRSILFS
ncbi:hypothetical protein A2954_00030 [Candidatus Roizmanbacteria bacterium RIFCSPLOWO2_01_FULL_37_12]|uniref:Uncharacterized protein n=1 Tax=Candidatus Roizmanbacteria bacterium RIFCSPLOWO2_01_FULL_37_12 TaxID=1802056 RepID=A0A1F7IBD0_9BACT|nr:MAG: hypothetical protein A3D76_00355 [Candidatus Roizmanbacteria bacterium RIFCSPHIGHO2_02_FULL_37_9b]OGK40671.1 MAG: hypothetical protein A2954_00030 [Candidatus Roizmanbacteria bacterium RIFCSPLOWO2_01_FULL_37_12]